MTTRAEGQLIRLDEARRALAKVSSVDEAKKIRDQAEALRNYAKQQQMGLEAQNSAAEIKIRAERRGGEISAAIETHVTGRPKKSSQAGKTLAKVPTKSEVLKKAGVSTATAHRWEEIASIPDPIFESVVAATRDAEEELTSAGLQRLARSNNPHAVINRKANSAPTVLWVKHLGKLDRVCRFFDEAADSIPKRSRDSSVVAISRCIKILNHVKRRIQ